MTRWLVTVLCCCALAGCARADLHTGLGENDANEMAAVLRDAGIDAAKSSKDGKSWALSVPRGKFPDAVAALQSRGYPKEHFDTLGEVFKKQGFVSSPVEEHARLIYGLSQELSSTISNIDGVLVARVQIALPEPDPLSEVQRPSSASVLIKYDPEVDLSSQVGAIKSLVVNSVEGLPYDRVTVILTPARMTMPSKPTSSGLAKYGAPAVIGLAALAALAAIGVLFPWLRRRRRPEIAQ